MCSCPSYTRYRQTPLRERDLMEHISRLPVCNTHTRTSESINAQSSRVNFGEIRYKGPYRNAFLAYLLNSRKRLQRYDKKQ